MIFNLLKSNLLAGQDGFGTVCCTGSNFLLRARHAAAVGWFPTYTMVRTLLNRGTSPLCVCCKTAFCGVRSPCICS